MKKLLALLLALVMVIGVSACGKTETVENENEVVESTQTPDTNADETEEPELAEDEKPEDSDKPSQTPSSKPQESAKPSEKPQESAKPSQKPAETPKTVGNKLLAEFKSKANSGSALSIAESLANGGSLPFMAGAMEVEPGFLSGFDNAEITGFKSGAVFQPMIGSIAFIGYVFELEDGVSSSDFIANLKNSANLRWNICVEAEEMVAGNVGNKVFFVMCPKAFEE